MSASTCSLSVSIGSRSRAALRTYVASRRRNVRNGVAAGEPQWSRRSMVVWAGMAEMLVMVMGLLSAREDDDARDMIL